VSSNLAALNKAHEFKPFDIAFERVGCGGSGKMGGVWGGGDTCGAHHGGSTAVHQDEAVIPAAYNLHHPHRGGAFALQVPQINL